MHAESERTARMNAEGHYEHIGLVCRSVGWLLLIFDTIPFVWIWVGLRTGSDMWLIWAAIEGFAGGALVVAGRFFMNRAAGQVGRREPDYYKAGNMELRWKQDHAV